MGKKTTVMKFCITLEKATFKWTVSESTTREYIKMKIYGRGKNTVYIWTVVSLKVVINVMSNKK